MLKFLLFTLSLLLISCAQQPVDVNDNTSNLVNKRHSQQGVRSYNLAGENSDFIASISSDNIPEIDNSEINVIEEVSRYITAQEGDDIALIARVHKLSEEDILVKNNWSKGYILSKGDIIKLPTTYKYVVQAGDDVEKIVGNYNITKSQLLEYNDFDESYILQPGDIIQLPESAVFFINDQDKWDIELNTASSKKKLHTSNHKREEEEFIDLGKKLDDKAVSQANKSYDLSYDKPIIAPTNSMIVSYVHLKKNKNNYVLNNAGKQDVKISNDIDIKAVKNLMTNGENAVQKPTDGDLNDLIYDGDNESKNVTMSSSDMNLIWPIKGNIINNFTNDKTGIEIEAAAGTPVRAAGKGTVIFSGKTNSYGKLILIDMGKGYIAAYGYVESILVDKNQEVDTYDIIAHVAESDQQTKLYFGIRKNKDPVDPVSFLRGDYKN